MFEVVDLVEDDKIERYSVDSLETGKTSFFSKEPFRLHGEGRKCQLFRLPGISVKEGGEMMRRMWNCEIDESILVSKGLQLNEDGSFSKSPRDDCLPFVMPAEKVAEIRRKKQEQSKRILPEKMAAKGKSTLHVNPPPVVTSRSSNCVPEDVKTGDNLTDSMKEALVRKRWEQEKTRLPRWKPSEHRLIVPVPQETCVKKEEMVQTMNNAKKNRSDLQLPSIHRPRLTYYQRYQKESGFDPQSISLKGLEEVKDTARSVYGDSAREAISDVSGRFAILEEDESEEAFYHRVITKGRNILHSAKPTLEKTNMVRTHEDHIRERIRERIQRAKEINMERKNVSLVSDLKASPIGCLITNRSGRKIHALCGKNPEPIPKAELVSRARAYGNQANTRNIVKLQMKSRLRQEGICGPGVKKCFKMEQRKSHLFLPPLEEKLSRNWDMKNNEKSVLDREMFRRNLSNMRMHIAGLRNALDRGEKG
ncbi:UNVERIFIED_CONTAM: hypothetical protein PYX00_005876 [Menopon gallinae]|uniref:Uncharacterized protein n=1 Tax=Menopon gallinae TaxID=328185 RepID=A0AAW2HTR5_9NEOP